MSKASDIFNRLPIEVRWRVRPTITELQIAQIRRDQDLAKESYMRFMNQSNSHVASLMRSLKADLEALSNPTGPELAEAPDAKSAKVSDTKGEKHADNS